MKSRHLEDLDPCPALILPYDAELKALLECASSGIVRSFCDHLEQLVQQDAKYTEFAMPLFTLAKQFKIEEIEGILEQYLHCSIAVP